MDLYSDELIETSLTSNKNSKISTSGILSSRAFEVLGYYVYCLVDPRDGKIFYIGKGKDDRMFQHALNAQILEDVETEKIEKIRDIINSNEEVRYYILRHGLTEDVAFEVESALIDLLTYKEFNLEKTLTNLASGHHQWDRGIKTIKEFNALYDTHPFEPNEDDKIVFININRSYAHTASIYEAAKGDWVFNINHVSHATHILVHYRGIVRAVFRPIKWHKTGRNDGRLWFEGEEIEDSPYLFSDIRHLKLNQFRPTHYYNF